MFCKKCGCDLEEGRNFCPNCGVRVVKKAEEKTVRCLKCGTKFAESAQYCPGCGKKADNSMERKVSWMVMTNNVWLIKLVTLLFAGVIMILCLTSWVTLTADIGGSEVDASDIPETIEGLEGIYDENVKEINDLGIRNQETYKEIDRLTENNNEVRRTITGLRLMIYVFGAAHIGIAIGCLVYIIKILLAGENPENNDHIISGYRSMLGAFIAMIVAAVLLKVVFNSNVGEISFNVTYWIALALAAVCRFVCMPVYSKCFYKKKLLEQ